MKEKVKRLCNLCGQEKVLIKSHIIPEGFYYKIYDSKKRLIYSSKSRQSLKYLQKGEREHLLCKECDGDVIGVYDRYATEVIRSKKHIISQENDRFLKWSNLEYNKFKLFHLSVLWRAHLAQERFKGVNLSTEIANQLRKIILSGIAPVENEFPVYGCKLIDPIKSANCDEIVTNGNCYTRLEEPNIQVYIFIFGGFAWMYIVPKSNEDDPQKDIFLKPSGDIILPKENIRDFQPFKDIYASILQVASSNSRK